MIALTWWQAILDGLGSVLSFLYDLVGDYGVAIILLTLGVRVLLLPLGIKQVRSMHKLQALQPKIKALQQKYKGNRQRLNEEMMKLYRENNVNPLGGCLPLLAQIPVLIALFGVLQFPQGLTHVPHNEQEPRIGTQYGDSQLYVDIINQEARFLGVNLVCTAVQAGKQVDIAAQQRAVPDVRAIPGRRLDCGEGIPARIPYYLLAVAMIGTTYYQQRQMQRAQPAGAQQQQQMLTKIMPLLFGFWGFVFPAGLVLYWTTTNLVQIAQQHFMLPRREAAPAGDGARKGTRGVAGWTSGLTDAWTKLTRRPVAEESEDPRVEDGPTPEKPRRGSSGSGGRGGGGGRSRKKRRKR